MGNQDLAGDFNSFNCTIEELKSAKDWQPVAGFRCFNCTIEELKLKMSDTKKDLRIVLIVP